MSGDIEMVGMLLQDIYEEINSKIKSKVKYKIIKEDNKMEE